MSITGQVSLLVNYSLPIPCLQAFINTAKEIYQKIQDGVFDINNEVCFVSFWLEVYPLYAESHCCQSRNSW